MVSLPRYPHIRALMVSGIAVARGTSTRASPKGLILVKVEREDTAETNLSEP